MKVKNVTRAVRYLLSVSREKLRLSGLAGQAVQDLDYQSESDPLWPVGQESKRNFAPLPPVDEAPLWGSGVFRWTLATDLVQFTPTWRFNRP